MRAYRCVPFRLLASRTYLTRLHCAGPATLLWRQAPRPCCVPLTASPLTSPRCGFASCAVRRASASHSTISAGDLRGALRALNLSANCTDAEIKAAFQAFAKANHPDTFSHVASTPKDSQTKRTTSDEAARKDAEARMFAGTQAYQLLRQLTFDDRQRLLRDHRFRADGTGFEYTEEEYRKAEAAYRGRPRTRASPSMEAETAAFNADFFNPNTHEGRTRTGQFNAFQARIRADRGRRAAWGMGSATADNGERVKTTAPGAGWRLGFVDRTWQELQTIRRTYEATPGFAGMDGSRYDSDANAARAGPELTHNPHMKQYLTMRQRAREKKVLDNAVGGALTAVLFFAACFAMAVLTVAGYRKIQANRHYDEIQRRKEAERGGG